MAELCRYAEMERKLNIIYDEMIKDNIYVPKFIGDEPRAMPPSEINTYEVITLYQNGAYNLGRLLTNTNGLVVTSLI